MKEKSSDRFSFSRGGKTMRQCEVCAKLFVERFRGQVFCGGDNCSHKLLMEEILKKGSMECLGCKKEHSLDKFSSCDSILGYKPRCKDCMRKYNRKRYRDQKKRKDKEKSVASIASEQVKKCAGGVVCGGIEKPISEFYKNASSSDGLQGECKECHKYYIKKSRDRRKEKPKRKYVKKSSHQDVPEKKIIPEKEEDRSTDWEQGFEAGFAKGYERGYEKGLIS